MILQIQIDCWDSKWKNLSQEEWADLRSSVPTLPEEKPDYFHKSLIVDDDGLRALARSGLQIRLDDSSEASNVNTMLVKLQERINALELRTERNVARLAAEGAAVQICIPDMPLMYVDKVEVVTNACTGTVQEMLDDGWRILAVCPPNAQRRPDYVLGRRGKL